MTSDVFWVFLTYLPTYPNQMVYYISLFSKIRCSLTYLPTQISDVIYECSIKCLKKIRKYIVDTCLEFKYSLANNVQSERVLLNCIEEKTNRWDCVK